MKMRIGLALAVVAGVLEVWADEPVLQLRLRTPDTRSDEEWASTLGIIRGNPGCCDEVWFSTGIGYPPLAVHAERAERMKRAAEDLRRIGIVPSLQVQATIGHSDRIGNIEDCSAKDWTGWTSSTGLEDRVCSCPRDPRFLAYFREVAKLYAAFRPGSAWIDDDLRYDGHMPASPHRDPRPGCWCDRCIADFSRETGGAWTRETLLRAVGTDAALLAKWKSFSVGSLVGVAQAIAGAFREASPGTMMGLQHGMRANESIRRILEGLHGTSGASVGYRPGGGCYFDDNPNEQVWKSMCTGRCRRALGDPPWVKVWTPEIESFPRDYGSRSAQSILVEGFTAFMYGMNAMSMLVIHTGHEPPELYSAKVLAPVAKAAPFLKAYARACAESTAVGFGTDGDIDAAHRFASLGIPLNVGVGKIEGMVSEDELGTDRRQVTTLRIQELRDALDRRAGGSTAVLESPFVGHMMPRVASDGSLRLVSLLNVRIEEQGPLTLRLRHVPDGCGSMVWREMNRAPVTLPLVREGDVVRVTVPSVSAWNAGWLEPCDGSGGVELPCEDEFAFRTRLEQVHEPDRRDASLGPATNEFAFTQGPVEIVCRETSTVWMKTAIADFRDYLETSMRAGGGKVRIETGDVGKGYETDVSADGVVIRAKDDRQAAQALFHLEDVMNLRRAPFLPFGTTRRVPRFSPRMVHSGLARDAFPHGYLMKLAHAGMDTVLLFIERAGLSACNTHNGTGDEIDCGAFIRRMRDYGFDTYIYLQATGFKHPSDPDAPAFFDDLYGGISKTCPGAKGYIVVDEKCHFPSKDPHVCKWDPKTRRNVDPRDPRPRPAYYPCSDYHDWLKCVTDSILRYSPEAEIVFWTYAFVWAPYEPRMEFIRRMPKDMSLMATFETGIPYEKRNGFRARVNDYSISEIGPGPFFREQAGEAVRQGLKVYSQANTAGLGWDFGTIPYNPVPYQWRRRWEALCAAQREFNVRGVMECHHYGVWPSFLTELEKESFTEGGIPFDEHLRRIAARDFGEANVVSALDAWKAWSEAIADMPATSENQYGPFRMGPAFLYNAFQPELTAADWWQGKVPWHTSSYATACGKGRPTEGIRRENELFRSMVGRYFDGAARFRGIAASAPADSRRREKALRMAYLGEYMGRAVQTALNIREGELAERAGDRVRATEIARREHANVSAAIELMKRDSRLGWEPTMGYQAGVAACEWKLRRLERMYGR